MRSDIKVRIGHLFGKASLILGQNEETTALLMARGWNTSLQICLFMSKQNFREYPGYKQINDGVAYIKRRQDTNISMINQEYKLQKMH